MKNILITGGLGFIGSNLAKRLVERKKELGINKIIVVDSLESECGGKMENVKDFESEIEVHRIRIGDEKMREIVKEIDVVFNLAGQTGHSISMEKPLLDLELNYIEQLKFLETIRKEKKNAIVIFASTRQVYGKQEKLPVTEKNELNPPDVNAVHKIAAEQLYLLYNKIYGIKTCILRATNVFGERQRVKDARLGVLGFFIGLALQNKKITLYDGKQIRDVNYVDDVADAFILSVLEIEKTNSEIFNIGGEKTSLLEFVEKIGNVINVDYKIEEFPEDKKKIDIGDFYADYSKFEKATGWKPRISIEEGIKRTIEFYKENKQYLT